MIPRIGLFLDTSILYSLRLKQPILCRHIQKICRPSRVFTGASVYSLLEFDQRVLIDAEYICDKIKADGYDAAKEWVNNVLPPRQSRKKTTCQLIFSLMDSQWRDMALRLGGTGMREIRDIKDWAVDWLNRFGYTELDALRKSIDHWNNGIECRAVAEIESRRRRGENRKPVRCSSADCQLSVFLEKNKENLHAISNIIQTLPDDEKTDELGKILKFIHEWNANPGQAFRREKGCRLIGDLLIALESGSFSIIYT